MGKLHTFTWHEHLEQLSLGRRLHWEQLGLGRRHPYIIVGIIGFSRVFQTLTVVLQTFLYLRSYTFSILTVHKLTDSYIQIKQLKYLWSHQL